MVEKIKIALQSRTVLSLLLIFFFYMPQVKAYMTEDVLEIVNMALALAGIYFRVDAKKTAVEQIKDVLSTDLPK